MLKQSGNIEGAIRRYHMGNKIRRYQMSDLKIPTVWSECNKGVLRKNPMGYLKTSMGLSYGTVGEIRKLRRRNQKISNGNERHKSKDRQFNVWKFADVKGEINHGKTNRVHKSQWPKENKTNNDLQNNTQKSKYWATENPWMNSNNPMSRVKL